MKAGYMPCPVCNVWTTVVQTKRIDAFTKERRYKCGNEHLFTTLAVEEITRVGAGKSGKPPIQYELFPEKS